MPRPVGDKARAVTSSSPSEDNERTVLPGHAKDELPTHHLSPHSSYPAEYARPLPPTSQLLQPPLRRQRGSQSQSQGQPGRGTSWPPKTSATTTVVAVSPTKRSSMVTPSLSPTQRRPASSTFSSLALQVGQKPTTVPSTPQVRMVSTTAAPRIRTTRVGIRLSVTSQPTPPPSLSQKPHISTSWEVLPPSWNRRSCQLAGRKGGESRRLVETCVLVVGLSWSFHQGVSSLNNTI